MPGAQWMQIVIPLDVSLASSSSIRRHLLQLVNIPPPMNVDYRTYLSIFDLDSSSAQMLGIVNYKQEQFIAFAVPFLMLFAEAVCAAMP